ncbi:MaoC family dehydratase [Patulibacter sp. S7RM1-6]
MNVLASAERRVTQADLDAWARLSGDWNPLHTDPTYAATTRFGRTIAFGHLTLTWLTALAGGLSGDGTLTGSSITGLRFRAPVLTEHDYRVLALAEEGAAADGPVQLEVRDLADDTLCASAVLTLDPTNRSAA